LRYFNAPKTRYRIHAVRCTRHALTRSANNIREVPAQIGLLTNLVVLDLSCNKCARISVTIRTLFDDGIGNQIKTLPKQMFQLIKLRHLDLYCANTACTRYVSADAIQRILLDTRESLECFAFCFSLIN
jgi:hypothetical protein